MSIDKIPCGNIAALNEYLNKLDFAERMAADDEADLEAAIWKLENGKEAPGLLIEAIGETIDADALLAAYLDSDREKIASLIIGCVDSYFRAVARRRV